MSRLPITGTQVDHGSQHHACSRELLRCYTGAGTHAVPDPAYTNGGIPSWSSPRTRTVSSPHSSVSYPGCWPMNGGYQYHVPAGPTTEYDSPMLQKPMISYDSVPAALLPSTYATLNPFSGMTSTPVRLGTADTSGQDVDVDTTTHSMHPYPTAVPPPAAVSGTATPASTLSDSGPVPEIAFPPVVRCMIDNCGQDIAVDRTILRQHLTTTHNYSTPHRSHSVLCRWSGCLCTRPSTCRSPSLGTGHGVHVEDVTEHVWTVHLSFQDVCGKCGDARWARGFSFQRHTNGCAGRKPARCVGCCQIFTSTAALVGHVELGLCEAALYG
jgi:hypothetical protein